MNEIKGTILTVCVMLVATELISKIVPQNKMMGFVRSLMVTVILISVVSTWAGKDFELATLAEDYSQNEELEEYVNGQYESAAQQEISQYITGLLQTIQIESEKIEIFTDITADGSILIEKVSVTTRYASDKERARALLQNTVGNEFEVEVTANGS
ncbi:hypothetical protein [Scatolibacter rhodanostii]|uniref:hypothetical protein n=1 Tax=Scatolibacter rhodanostii TaxID=2014781 RepID=UPI000C08762D|nr:hypothetical protein [Scatolibacter rhodanostii]